METYYDQTLDSDPPIPHNVIDVDREIAGCERLKRLGSTIPFVNLNWREVTGGWKHWVLTVKKLIYGTGRRK